MSPSIYESLAKHAAASAESLYAMMHQEQTTYKMSCDYLHPPTSTEPMINESDRVKIVDWCYSVVDQCKFDRETVAISMEMVDRFLSTPSAIARDALRDRKRFQLVAITAMYVAIKTNEQMAFGSGSFAKMSRGIYSKEDIEAMERSMLDGLSWRVCAPTSIQMAHHILSLALPYVDLEETTWAFILDEVRYQTEHAVRDYYFASKRPSTVAVAAIFNTLDQVKPEERQAILRALLSILNEGFDSPRDLFAARNRLMDAVAGNEALSDDDTVLSEATQEVEAWHSPGGSDDIEHSCVHTASPRTCSLQSVACCRRENILCERCIGL